MVKHRLRIMSRFFTRERFAAPQFLAALLLLAFLAQCLWLLRDQLHKGWMLPDESFRITRGLRFWGRTAFADQLSSATTAAYSDADGEPASNSELTTAEPSSVEPPPYFTPDGYDPHHSRLWYLIASGPLVVWPGPFRLATLPYALCFVRLPYIVIGLLLGASVWYVSRRLYGNAGGYVALTLYCFSPGMIRNGAVWFAQPEMGAAWGAFGAIFTAIAVSHTLYAPREVVLWNWRRILLLGLSLTLAVGLQFSLVIVIPVALAFMLYLAPMRRRAAAVIWIAACAAACVLLLAGYFFNAARFFDDLRHASFLPLAPGALRMAGAYRQLAAQIGQMSPALALALPATLITYAAWRRARYFGNTAPLLSAVLFLLLALATPHYPGLGFVLMATPFLFVFVAGVTSDLLETSWRPLVQAAAWGLLSAYALWSVLELTRV